MDNSGVISDMKICSVCGIEQSAASFSKDARRKSGIRDNCKSCSKRYKSLYNKTKTGAASLMYSGQKSSSERRGHPPPSYTRKEFFEWLFNKPEFHKLFDLWVESGYKKMQKPSADRLDDNSPYSLDNLRVVTWQENFDKGCECIKRGINNRTGKAVKQTTLDGFIVSEYHSQSEASRKTGVARCQISLCCNNKLKSAGGWKWSAFLASPSSSSCAIIKPHTEAATPLKKYLSCMVVIEVNHTTRIEWKCYTSSSMSNITY